MKRTSRLLALAGASMLAASSLVTSDAHACGGCFHPSNDPETTVVTGHRMAFSISKTQTVLWDQVEYAGNPQEFAWVLPVKPGAYLELASSAWFETLDAATTTRVTPPPLNCAPFNGNDFFPGGFDEGGGSGCACGSADASGASFDMAAGAGDFGGVNDPPAPPPVTVVDRAVVGPYEVLTLQANVPGVLVDWLSTYGFAIDESIQPIIDQYQSEGFNFIVMRLQPDFGVQSMKPVRVVSPGASPALPLRMVAAGTGANTAVTLFVIGEGRWQAQNFPNTAMYPALVTWDYATSSSDYAQRRVEMLALDEGRTWLGSYARQGSLLSPLTNGVGNPNVYSTQLGNMDTIGKFFAATGFVNGETAESSCADKFNQYASSMDLVVDPCTDPNGTCVDVMPGQIDMRDFECGAPESQPDVKLDDLAVALTGMHPASVWVTRLEGNLSRVALEKDLVLEAEPKQAEVDNWIQAGRKANVPCTEVSPAAMLPPKGDSPQDRKQRSQAAAIALGLAGLIMALARRAKRAALPAFART